MKQTLKDFLAVGLNRLEKGQFVDGVSGKYQANCTSDFDGAVFNTKNEARAVWQAKDQEEKQETKYMNLHTGSIDTYDGWWYENEDGEVVNAVDRGEVVELEK